jgi:hypothetical protein
VTPTKKRLDLDSSLTIAMQAVDRELAKLAVCAATQPQGLASSEVKALAELTKLVLLARKDSRDAALLRRVERMPDAELIAELQRHAASMAAS